MKILQIFNKNSIRKFRRFPTFFIRNQNFFWNSIDFPFANYRDLPRKFHSKISLSLHQNYRNFNSETPHIFHPSSKHFSSKFRKFSIEITFGNSIDFPQEFHKFFIRIQFFLIPQIFQMEITQIFHLNPTGFPLEFHKYVTSISCKFNENSYLKF